jgi:hypothetical protein
MRALAGGAASVEERAAGGANAIAVSALRPNVARYSSIIHCDATVSFTGHRLRVTVRAPATSKAHLAVPNRKSRR